MDLLEGQAPLPVSHQMESCLRLATCLRKTRVLIDPLKVLFRLILRKALIVPVFALILIGEIYKKCNKLQEALEVYTAASEKLNHLNLPLKFRIYDSMGVCYKKLGLSMEALRSYKKAFSGNETFLVESTMKHSKTRQR